MPISEKGSKWLVSVGSGLTRYRATFATRQEAILAEEAEIFRRQRERFEKKMNGRSTNWKIT